MINILIYLKEFVCLLHKALDQITFPTEEQYLTGRFPTSNNIEKIQYSQTYIWTMLFKVVKCFIDCHSKIFTVITANNQSCSIEAMSAMDHTNLVFIRRDKGMNDSGELFDLVFLHNHSISLQRNLHILNLPVKVCPNPFLTPFFVNSTSPS